MERLRNSSQTIHDTLRGADRHKVNELFWYHIDPAKKWAFIHLLPKAEDLKTKKGIELFKAGLSHLAEKLEQEDKLKNIKHVLGISSLIKKNPRILKMLGFKIYEFGSNEPIVRELESSKEIGKPPKDPAEDASIAAISREDFLKRPWENKKPAS